VKEENKMATQYDYIHHLVGLIEEGKTIVMPYDQVNWLNVALKMKNITISIEDGRVIKNPSLGFVTVVKV